MGGGDGSGNGSADANNSQDDEEKRGKMVGFLFGNVDDQGRLDEDYLEEEAKDNIEALDGKLDDAPGEDGLGQPLPTGRAPPQEQAVAAADTNGKSIPDAELAPIVSRVRQREEIPDEDEDYDAVEETPKPAAVDKVVEVQAKLEAPSERPSARPSTGRVQTDPSSSRIASVPAGPPLHEMPSAKLKKRPRRHPGRELRPLPTSVADDELELLVAAAPKPAKDKRKEQSLLPLSVSTQDDYVDGDTFELSAMMKNPEYRMPLGSKFKAGLPLKEALKLFQDEVDLNYLGRMSNVDFHQFLNYDWERYIDWAQQPDANLNGRRGDGTDGANGTRNNAACTVIDSHIQPMGGSFQADEVDEVDDLDAEMLSMMEGDEEKEGEEGKKEPPQKFNMRPMFCPQLESNNWASRIGWDSEADQEGNNSNDEDAGVMLDLNDGKMIFESTGKKPLEVDRFLSLIIPHLSEKASARKSSKADEDILQKFNVSNDEYYFSKKEEKGKKDSSLDQKVRHSQPALKMLTSPLTETMSVSELKALHRPRGIFIPSRKVAEHKVPALKFGGSYQVNATLRSLVGFEHSIPHPLVANATTVETLWLTAKEGQVKFQRAFRDDRPKLMLSGVKRPLKSQFLLGEGDKGLNLKGDVTVWIVTNKISLIKNVNYKRHQEPLRPPGAFRNVKDLSPRDGHLFLFEYVEEYPLLLNNPGMGARLLSFYKKAHQRDDAWKSFKVPKVASPRDGSWGKYGHVIPLSESDDPPFLGDVPKGSHQLGIDCNLFRAPAFHNPVPSSDFLLVRTNLGRWMIRELSCVMVLGQEEPRVKTPWPGSIQIREYEERRFPDFVFRSLRKKLKESAGSSTGPQLVIQQLKHLFPNNSEQLIRNRLRQLCGCVPVSQTQSDGRWRLKPGARIPEEVELRQMCTPEMVCAYESMRSCQERLAARGIKRHELLRVSQERLKLAMDLLPDEVEVKEAARFIERMLQIASWALISNYHDVMKEGRGTFMLSGLGDPSGRGRGFSFVKAPTRGADSKQTGSTKVNSIAGTKMDLRRLSMGKAHQILRTLGVPDDEIAQLTRWNRINLIQKLSTAAAADGSELGEKYGGFARTHRKSVAEAQRSYQLKCQGIFNKQVLALSEVTPIDGSPYDAESLPRAGKQSENVKVGQRGEDLANELENMLEDGDDDEDQDKQKTEAELMAEDKAEMALLRQEGLFGERKKKKEDQQKAAESAKDKGPKRRLRRIFRLVHPDGSIETREVTITDANKIETLRLARANYGGFGEGGMINLTKERKRLQDRHLKLKKRIIKQKKHLALLKEADDKNDPMPESKSDGSTKFTLKGVKVKSSPGARSTVPRKKAPKKRRVSPTQKLNRLLREKIHMPIRTMPISRPFASKVDTGKFKDYGKYVQEQITLGEMSKLVQQNQYQSWMGYQAQILQLVANAKAYNDAETGGVYKNPNIAQQAEFLQILINLRIARYATGIIEAQERCEPELVALRQKYNDELPWVECSRCKKWRLVSFEQHQGILGAKSQQQETVWYCENNADVEGASCDDPADEDTFNEMKRKYLVQ